MKFICYTDGSYSRKYDKGASAYLISLDDSFGQIIKEAKEVPNATNQIAELNAVKLCLQKLVDISNNKCNNIEVLIYSDSKYCVSGLNDWIFGWLRNNWQNANKEPVANKELWIEVYNLKQKFKSVKLEWVKGHSGNTGNEIVDKLCFELTRG